MIIFLRIFRIKKKKIKTEIIFKKMTVYITKINNNKNLIKILLLLLAIMEDNLLLCNLLQI